MATNENSERYKCLMAWMKERDILFPIIAEKLKVGTTTILVAMQRETCPTSHHKKMIKLGFPADLLPIPMDKPRGRQRREPRFPCSLDNLSAGAESATNG